MSLIGAVNDDLDLLVLRGKLVGNVSAPVVRCIINDQDANIHIILSQTLETHSRRKRPYL